MRLALLSQVVLLLIGLIVPIGVPAAMGLEYYGHFVAATASAFLVQRLADFPSETLIFAGTPRSLLLRAAALQAVFLAIAAVALAVADARIDLFFLLGLQISSVAFAMVLSCRSERLTLAYLSAFLAAYLMALVVAITSGWPLVNAISVPNYLAGLWIPVVLRLGAADAALQVPEMMSRPRSAWLDLPLRVAAGSFVAFATLGLATLPGAARAAESAQVRLLGTALGMAAFLLPWPMKSLVGVLKGAQPVMLASLLRYLLGVRVVALALVAAGAIAPVPARPFLLCAGTSLLFLNYQVVERWNVAEGRLALQACVALLATLVAFFAFRASAGHLAMLPCAVMAILLGGGVYGLCSQRLLPAPSLGRRAASGLWLSNLLAAGVLGWTQR